MKVHVLLMNHTVWAHERSVRDKNLQGWFPLSRTIYPQVEHSLEVYLRYE